MKVNLATAAATVVVALVIGALVYTGHDREGALAGILGTLLTGLLKQLVVTKPEAPPEQG